MVFVPFLWEDSVTNIAKEMNYPSSYTGFQATQDLVLLILGAVLQLRQAKWHIRLTVSLSGSSYPEYTAADVRAREGTDVAYTALLPLTDPRSEGKVCGLCSQGVSISQCH